MGPSVLVTAAVLSGLLGSILPTCLYLYVEPRGRLGWGQSDQPAAKRRAPVLVRLSAWLGFALAQLALPWLVVPVACVANVYLQSRLGIARPLGVGVTLGVGAMALVQSALTLRLFPIGIRLLVGDSALCGRLQRVATVNAVANGLLIAAVAASSWSLSVAPGFVYRWLHAVLAWTALRPVMIYAVAGLVHALLLRQCPRLLADRPRTE